MLNELLLKIVCCPACRERPHLRLYQGYLVCDQCRRAYPIRQNIPILLVDEAIPMDQIREGAVGGGQ